jgi:HAD superfamily hydrolase (TIGR01549 family)
MQDQVSLPQVLSDPRRARLPAPGPVCVRKHDNAHGYILPPPSEVGAEPVVLCPPMRAQAVFLDLDGTLLDYDADAWRQTVRAVSTELSRTDQGLYPDELGAVYTRTAVSYFREAEAAREQVADGHAIWRTLWQAALTECGRSDTGLADVALAAYEADRAARYRLYADVLPTLARLRERVRALVLITNGPGSTQRHKATATGLTELLDAVIVSGEVGVAKPDPAIFALAAAAANVDLAAAWHVGDSLTSDVAGARNAGLGAGVWLNRTGDGEPVSTWQPGDAQPDYEIASLCELPALLG